METIENKYKLDGRQLGRGGFSEVYLGTDIRTGQIVAIKKISLKTKNLAEKDMLEKVQGEIDIMQTLDHPNIVRYYDVVKTSQYWYIVMEYCDMGTLQDVIEYHNSASKNDINFNREANTWYYLEQLRSALSYLQLRGYTHRDIKPMNVLLTSVSNTVSSSANTGSDNIDSQPLFDMDNSLEVSSEMIISNPTDIDHRETGSRSKPSTYHWREKIVLKLADFGLTKAYQDNESSLLSTICGSPLFMAPELIRQEKYDSKVDLWAFGIIMYQLLHGTHPFQASSRHQLLRNIRTQNIDFHLHKNFTVECFDLLRNLLVNSPDKRLEWSDLFEHKWFSYWTNNINREHVIITESIKQDYQSYFKRKTSTPIKIDTNNPSIRPAVLSAFHLDPDSSPTFVNQIGNNFPISSITGAKPNTIVNNNINNSRDKPSSPLGPSNLSKMRVTELHFHSKPGTYEEYARNRGGTNYPASYPVGVSTSDSKSKYELGQSSVLRNRSKSFRRDFNS